ncbi:uncharacterized protein LOC122383152 [Amphibalanus amphitrite]|uniref:uncharacterized protein LOC122383152 n=1 Tax=Amphibalanus amphitrite TaxID=1232801 RepID=UPI001C91264F|nr:uncharacterized protein LOC122383152 [Amphibalanus amphitrite]
MAPRVLTWALTCALTVLGASGLLVDPPRLLGELKLANAAFVEVYTAQRGEGDDVARKTLYVSSFNPGNIIGDDKVYYLRAPGRQMAPVAEWDMKVLDHHADWTNDICYTPPEAVGFEGVTVTSGFLVPFKTHGKLQVFNTEVEPPAGPYLLTTLDTKDWAYHRALWHDMDGDGDLDLSTARFHQNSITGHITKSFAYMTNDGVNPADSGRWHQVEVIADGPDVGFRWLKLPSGGKTYDVLLGGEFWNERLTVYWTEDGDWSNPENVQSRIVDDTTGQVFDVFYDDLNGDGVPEVWASCFDLPNKNGSLYKWTIPDDFINGDWERTTLDTNFHPNSMLFGETMSPGSAIIFHPSDAARDAGNKPLILLSGDDDGNQYILQPVSQDPSDWTYARQTLVETGGTTAGQVTADDIDGDGYTELITAGYTVGKVYVFTYAP